MGIVVDTSVFIALERQPPNQGTADLPPDEECRISVITASELLVGVHRADSQARRNRRSAFVEAVLARFPVLPIDEDVARLHAQLTAQQVQSGQAVGAHDLLIAATALARGDAVLTRDVDDFGRVAGLTVISAL